MPWVIVAGIAAGAYFIDKAGEAAENSANALVKVGVAAGIGLLIAKKARLI